jgi:hypothetical protein
MAPAGAPAHRGYGEHDGAVCACHCGNGDDANAGTYTDRKRTRQSDQRGGSIEVEIQGMTVRIGRGADAKTIAAVLRALKAVA